MFLFVLYFDHVYQINVYQNERVESKISSVNIFLRPLEKAESIVLAIYS